VKIDEVQLVEGCQSSSYGAEDGQPAQRAAGLAGSDQRLQHHHRDGGEGEQQLGEDGEEVGGH
jgi:hypothetical protein